jgi:hypothetical protein
MLSRPACRFVPVLSFGASLPTAAGARAAEYYVARAASTSMNPASCTVVLVDVARSKG